MTALKNILLKEIENLRSEMTEVANDYGFASKESLLLSQELDRLLNVYHGLNVKKSTKRKVKVLKNATIK